MFKVTIKIASFYRMKLLSSNHDVYVTKTKVSHLLALLSDLYKKFSTKLSEDEMCIWFNSEPLILLRESKRNSLKQAFCQ